MGEGRGRSRRELGGGIESNRRPSDEVSPYPPSVVTQAVKTFEQPLDTIHLLPMCYLKRRFMYSRGWLGRCDRFVFVFVWVVFRVTCRPTYVLRNV